VVLWIRSQTHDKEVSMCFILDYISLYVKQSTMYQSWAPLEASRGQCFPVQVARHSSYV
jgi:hypothetical protein